ncbi:SPOR domain-containing protein [Alishewanella tabrizica]|uniref:Cell division protein FtsN n=1 Tax=Alishewanella tabrizica TaxID=671278 RepID=A0ABQ2WHK5_9ALTE|nr:SPOR domain-containing protein [Alishewanella tabrizica]GGW52059.1 cell division protein FtsN [Alishewanella tabrizica]
MPQKDYVRASRPKPANKNQSNTRNSRGSRAKAVSANKPWLLIALSSFVIIAFVFGLWFLKQQTPVNTDPVATTPTPTKPQTKDELPPKPVAEPYQYIQELENKEVTVELTEQRRSGPAQLQCGSFRQQSQAEAMKAQIAFAGITADVRRTEGTNGVWYRIILGPYESRRAATVDMNRLRQMGINTCQVRNWA